MVFEGLYRADKRIVTGLEPATAPDLTVIVQFTQADRTEGEWLFVSFVDQTTTIHETLKVRTVSHAKHVANFVTGCFEAPVYQKLFSVRQLIDLCQRLVFQALRSLGDSLWCLSCVAMPQ